MYLGLIPETDAVSANDEDHLPSPPAQGTSLVAPANWRVFFRENWPARSADIDAFARLHGGHLSAGHARHFAIRHRLPLPPSSHKAGVWAVPKSCGRRGFRRRLSLCPQGCCTLCDGDRRPPRRASSSSSSMDPSTDESLPELIPAPPLVTPYSILTSCRTLAAADPQEVVALLRVSENCSSFRKNAAAIIHLLEQVPSSHSNPPPCTCFRVTQHPRPLPSSPRSSSPSP